MKSKTLAAVGALAWSLVVCAQPTPSVPKTWDKAALEAMQVPLADPRGTPVQVPEGYYYRIPVRAVFKAYPVYLPDREPKTYQNWLMQQEPQSAFDAATLKTEADWIRAGEVVFDWPLVFQPYSREALEEIYLKVHRQQKLAAAADGTIPYLRIVIRKKGVLELGLRSCGTCHSRVQADGTVIKGAQGTFPNISLGFGDTTEFARSFARFLYSAPWIQPDPISPMDKMSVAEITALHEAIPIGVIARHGSSPFSPVQVPDLIGIQDRRYLDHTGLLRHSGAADLMRYAALNQGRDDIAAYGAFIPITVLSKQNTLPPPEALTRYSDEQLYALALYLYSLRPPPNPNKRDELSARGEKVFQREGCAGCHTPPLYTNNKLTPALGFRIPVDHKTKYDILPVVVGTDPMLATATRRGTGYYKVPSLKGVWYRGPFEHEGSVKSLEDWFDPARLRDDYVPTGFVGYGRDTRAIRGHEFGLRLDAGDKAALIAFLKTL